MGPRGPRTSGSESAGSVFRRPGALPGAIQKSIKSQQPSGRQWFRSILFPTILQPITPHPSGKGFTPSLPFPVDPGRADMNPPCLPFGAQSPPRSDPKIHQFFDRFLNPFWHHFGSQNGSQSCQKSLKNQSKTESGMKNVNF